MNQTNNAIEKLVAVTRGIGGYTLPNRGATDSWITPKNIIDALGPFDLDPCQCTPQPWVCAENAFGIDQNGLKRVWFARFCLNPPYSEVWAWVERLADHNRGTALIFARTETEGFVKHVWNRATAIMFIHGRLFFYKPDGSRAKGNSGGPSCLVAYGNDDAQRLKTSGLAGSIVSWNTSLKF
jgi:hypothetical protein